MVKKFQQISFVKKMMETLIEPFTEMSELMAGM
jgi:hypothetical protein